MKKIYIHALNSCGMRNVQIAALRGYFFPDIMVVDKIEEADTIWIWTCAFRADYRDHSLKAIENFSREYGEENIIVGGCLPDIYPDELKHFTGKVVPWKSMEFGNYLPHLFKPALYTDEKKFRAEHPDEDCPYVGRYIQLYIAEGCNEHCTYCSEKLAFPPFKSYPPEKILESAFKATAYGETPHFCLLADNTFAYGEDINGGCGTNIFKLIDAILERIPEAKFAIQDVHPRLMHVYLSEISKLINRDKIMHLQIPIQSASDKVLKAMKRGYDTKKLDEVFKRLSHLEFTEIDTHLIIGFPGEDTFDFAASTSFVVDHKIKYVMASAYMEAPGAPSSGMSQKVKPSTVAARLQIAAETFKSREIICNIDGGDLAKERFRRMQ